MLLLFLNPASITCAYLVLRLLMQSRCCTEHFKALQIDIEGVPHRVCRMVISTLQLHKPLIASTASHLHALDHNQHHALTLSFPPPTPLAFVLLHA